MVESKSILESLWNLPSAVLGAAGVKLWEAGIRRWKQRLQPREEMVLLIAYVNHGTLQWDQDHEGKVTVRFKLIHRLMDYNFEEQGEIGALITKGFMEVVNNGYQRRLTSEGYKKAEALKRSKRFVRDSESRLERHLEVWFKDGMEPERK